ncbi:MAG: FtsW/RodA/SpoVE family cell cycle protein [Culicoidibacterales bacterium]
MKRLKRMDFPLFLMILAFCFIGLIAVYSATLYSSTVRYGQGRSFFLIRQIMFMILGYLLYFVVMHIDFRIHKRLSFIYLLVIFGMLGIVYFTGKSTLGAARWLDIGPFRLQPAEFAKIGIVLFVAYYFEKIGQKQVTRNMHILYLSIIAFVMLFTLIQPDNGSVVIMLVTIFLMYITMFYSEIKARKTLIVATLSLIVFLTVLFLLFSYSNIGRSQDSHILTRFISWVNPFAEYETRGYQLSNSYIAISNGGSIGVGLGNGAQKLGYLPDGHTDFIVASMSEEFGLIAVALIMLGYLFILWRMMKISTKVKSQYGRLVVLGLTILFFAQSAWNLAGVSGVLPLKGLTAPFLSYGGSSLFMLFILFGIVQNIYMSDQVKVKGKGKE